MALDFSTVGAELSYWLAHIGQSFKGGYSGSGENGIDVPMPVGTPVYAIAGGTVKGKGYYGGGGVVSVREQPGKVWYYQHLDLVEPSIASGQTKEVQPGQLVGWSGGQTGYGNHPVSSLAYSNDGQGHGWPHIEVGINAPAEWGPMWGGGEGPNVDPVPLLHAKATSASPLPTGQTQSQLQASNSSSSGPLDFFNFFSALRSNFGSVFTWLADPLRILKFFMGVGLLMTGVLLFIVPNVIGPGLQIAGAVSANPALSGIGAALTKNPNSILARGAQGYGQGLAATRQARESGRLSGVEQEQQAMKAELSRRAKKGAQTRKANATAAKQKPPAAAAAPDAGEEPVYSGKEQIGVMRGGEFVPTGKRPPEAIPPPSRLPKVPQGGLSREAMQENARMRNATERRRRESGKKVIRTDLE